MISVLLFVLFLVFMALRLPVSMAIGLAVILAMIAGGYDPRSIPQIMARSTQSFELMAVPFFILAANLMNALGMTQRIFDFAASVVGFIRGGLAHVNVLASMIFAGISGAAVADAAGLGTIELRAMRRAGYDLGFSTSVTISSSTIGPIIPPSIMMVIYAIIADVSIARMFIAGLIPGVLIGVILMVMIYVMVATGYRKCPPPVPFSWRRCRDTAISGMLSLIAPIIILWGMVGGVVTPTEAGVLAVGYSLVIGAVYRSYKLSELPQVIRDTVETSALIMYITAISSVMSWLMVNEGTAHEISAWLSGASTNPIFYLLIINVLLLIVGCILETLPAMLITVPILLPTAIELGIDPVHFGIIVIFNLLVGIITPPMGIGLYIMIAISGIAYGHLVRASLPFLLILLATLFLITYVPPLTLFLPDLLLK